MNLKKLKMLTKLRLLIKSYNFLSKGTHNLSNLVDYMKENNISYNRIYSELPTLNDVFLSLTGKELRD